MSARHLKTSRAVRRKYNFLAKIYDLIYRNYVRTTVRMAAEPLRLTGAERLLDIGCGTGALEKELLEQHPALAITGVDISQDMLELARKKLAGFPKVRFLEGDFLKTELPENHFDVVFSLSNFHYFTNPEAVLRKAHSHLKPGGRLILIDWNRDSFKGRLYQAYMSRFDPAFAKVYNPQEMKGFFESARFRIETIDRFRVGLLWRMMRVIAAKT